MNFILVFAACLSVTIGSALSNTACSDFRYEAACIVSSDNFEGEVSVDIIGDFPANCQTLCYSISSCNWFNYLTGDQCQLLGFCEQFTYTPGAISGPTTPCIESCQIKPCDHFHYNSACVVSSDNIEGKIDVGLIGDSPAACQALCLAVHSCSWFNYYKGYQCQLLSYCEAYEAVQDAVSGPTRPPIDSCETPPFKQVRKVTIDLYTTPHGHRADHNPII